MITVLENGKVDARQLWNVLEIKTRFSMWFERVVERTGFEMNKEYFPILGNIKKVGKPELKYEFTLDAAKEACIVSDSNKAKEVRLYLISLSNKRDNLELITTKEAAFAFKVINCLQYIENQKEALNIHREKFISENMDSIDSKFIYAQFYKYRSNIIGWDKQKVDAAIDQYLSNYPIYKRNKIAKEDMQTKLSIMDIGEAIRVAVLDILYSNNENEDMANKFAAMCKQLAKDMQIEPARNNESNIFVRKQNVIEVNTIKLN